MAVRFPAMPQVVDPVETHINHFIDYLIACLQQRRIQLFKIARDTRLEIEARQRARARKQQELNEMKGETERLLQTNELHEKIQRILAELEEKLAPQPKTRLLFRGATRDLEQLILGLGEIIEEEVPTVPRYQEMKPIVAVAKNGQAPGELWWPHGVAIDSNTNQIYVADGDGNFARVSIFAETEEFLNFFTHEHMREPWGIAIHCDNVYVTDLTEHFVLHFKLTVEFQFVARLGGKGCGIGQLYTPRQLTVSTNGDVYVADFNNHRIQILDSELHYQRHLSHHSMTRPCDVKLTPDGVYVLSYTDSPCVHVFSHAGEKIHSLITSCGDVMQVNNPWFFCLDANGNFIISDLWAHQFKVFSKDGTLIHTLGEEGHEKGLFYRPQGLVLTENLRLVTLSRNNSSRLQIFSC